MLCDSFVQWVLSLKSSLFLSPSTPRIRIRSDRGHTTRACLTHETHTRTPQRRAHGRKSAHHTRRLETSRVRRAALTHATHTHTHKTRHTSVVYSAAPLPVLVRRAVGTPHQRMCTHTQHENVSHTLTAYVSHDVSHCLTAHCLPHTRLLLISSYRLLLISSYCPAAPHPCSSASAAWVTAARCLP